MLSLIYLLNNKNIRYSYIVIFCLLILFISYINYQLLFVFFIDFYIYISLSQFTINEVKNTSEKSKLKMNITTEGLEKDEKNVKSILLNYLSKFN